MQAGKPDAKRLMHFSPPHLEDGARWAGMRIGLLGGSFNPPHYGHVHASVVALKALKLDCLWWLVSPQNPLKQQAALSFEKRFELCRAIIPDHRIIVSDLEIQLGTSRTWQTVRGLKTHFPKTSFVWVTGMDNALSLHTWHNWTYILDHVATAHVARPPAWSLIENCPLKMMGTQKHIYVDKAMKAPLLPRHTYWLMQNRMLGVSSTEIRNSLSDGSDEEKRKWT